MAWQEWERWTGAIGFCDLLSLYLCSGAADPVELPLGHPFDVLVSGQARRIRVQWRGDLCCIEPRIFPAGMRISQYVMVSPAPDGGGQHESTTLEWEFA